MSQLTWFLTSKNHVSIRGSSTTSSVRKYFPPSLRMRRGRQGRDLIDVGISAIVSIFLSYPLQEEQLSRSQCSLDCQHLNTEAISVIFLQLVVSLLQCQKVLYKLIKWITTEQLTTAQQLLKCIVDYILNYSSKKGEEITCNQQ